jgi:hypothetical protein
MEKFRIRDGKKSDPGSGINIPDPQHWSQDLVIIVLQLLVVLRVFWKHLRRRDGSEPFHNVINKQKGKKKLSIRLIRLPNKQLQIYTTAAFLTKRITELSHPGTVLLTSHSCLVFFIYIYTTILSARKYSCYCTCTLHSVDSKLRHRCGIRKNIIVRHPLLPFSV